MNLQHWCLREETATAGIHELNLASSYLENLLLPGPTSLTALVLQ